MESLLAARQEPPRYDAAPAKFARKNPAASQPLAAAAQGKRHIVIGHVSCHVSDLDQKGNSLR